MPPSVRPSGAGEAISLFSNKEASESIFVRPTHTAGTERVQREMVEAVGIEPTSATPKNHEIRTPSGYPPAGVALSFQKLSAA